MKPTYIFKCKTCEYHTDTNVRTPAPNCGLCGQPMVRDYKGEDVGLGHGTATSRDLYLQDLKRRANKKKDKRYF